MARTERPSIDEFAICRMRWRRFSQAHPAIVGEVRSTLLMLDTEDDETASWEAIENLVALLAPCGADAETLLGFAPRADSKLLIWAVSMQYLLIVHAEAELEL